MVAIASETIERRGGHFPSPKADTITQQDSVLVLHPTLAFSVVEANVWGQLMYSCEIEELIGKKEDQFACIRLYPFLGYILVFLEHALTMYRRIGYNGPLLIRTLLKRVRDKPFLDEGSFSGLGPASSIDDEISFDISSSAERLIKQRDQVAGDLLKVMFFSLNWPGAAGTVGIESLLNAAKVMNGWRDRS